MTDPLARQAIAFYAALVILLNVSVALPGNPDFSSGWTLVGGFALQAWIVWRLWHCSTAAWLLGLLFALGGFVSIYLAGGLFNVATVLFGAVCAAQAATLALPPIATFVWRRDELLPSR